MSNSIGYIYLIYLREFINGNLDIYKIGCCQDVDKRKRQYPKSSIYIFYRFTTNYKEIENKIKQEFSLKYIQRRDIGIEHFQCDHHVMIDHICKIINEFNTFRKNQFSTNIIKEKTLIDFCNESLHYDSNSSGLSVDEIHEYYTEYWLKYNVVKIAHHNLNDFTNQMYKIIGKSVGKIFIGQKWLDHVIDKKFPKKMFNPYDNFVNKVLFYDSNDKERLKQSELNLFCASWLKNNDLYQKVNFNSMDLKVSIEKLFGTMIKSLQFKDKKISRGWKHIKIIDTCNEANRYYNQLKSSNKTSNNISN